MNNSGKQQSFSDRQVDDQQQSNDDLSPVSDGTGEVSPAAASGDSLTRRNGNNIGLAARLTDLFAGDGDRDIDLLMQRNTQEGTVVQWLEALDMQVLGACRADERLKPLLKLNVSSEAEDRLLSHLSQHFEPSKVSLLARCLCIPLVSIRVGKINKQGTRLIPTSARGNLVLSLLPTSDLRILFVGDDGHAERISILRNTTNCSYVVIEGIPTDTSGRSFVVRVPMPFYFWCSEKSKLLGDELLEKMRKLLERKPSLAELTGISNSRLQRFVHHLQTFLVGSVSETSNSKSPPLLASSSSKASRVRTCSSIIQGSLSPRPSSFKEGGLPRNIASLRNVVRDKLRRRVEGVRLDTSSEKHPLPSTSNQHEENRLPESSSSSSGICLFPSVLSGNMNMQIPSIISATHPLPNHNTNTNTTPSSSSIFSPPPPPPPPPYYCWCPPMVVVTPQHPHTTSTESFTLPPLSSLLAAASSSAKTCSEISIPLPPFLPLSMGMPPSQQIPFFTPLICECDHPIVHIPIPVMDICSSGQAYLVSTGPTVMSVVSIPPALSVQESDLEKSARDTLRLLMSGSTQFPSGVGGGSFYGATTTTDVNVNVNVNAIANNIAAMSLVSPHGVMKRCIDQGDLVDLLKDPVNTVGTTTTITTTTTTCSSNEDGLSEKGSTK
ncbi:uncharacterized protein LOC111919725 [Lactuca sativa]|uniref:uncharacterized protein LOC111919725 n=1 Tax=Lactuca sativa TaxID=4236 RepID=UPI0022AFCFD5|nr:uncharacterized protein LOC111919725 [Lactuca sativa]